MSLARSLVHEGLWKEIKGHLRFRENVRQKCARFPTAVYNGHIHSESLHL